MSKKQASHPNPTEMLSFLPDLLNEAETGCNSSKAKKRKSRKKAAPPIEEHPATFIFSADETTQEDQTPTEELQPLPLDEPAAQLLDTFIPQSLFDRAAITPDAEQKNAIFSTGAPTLVTGQPGSGKTQLIPLRILHLLDEGIPARRIAAITTTRAAAARIDSFLRTAIESPTPLPVTDTLYGLGLALWHKVHGETPLLLSEETAFSLFASLNAELPADNLEQTWKEIHLARHAMQPVPEEKEEYYQRYAAHKTAVNLADHTDILVFWREQIISSLFVSPWNQIIVDDVHTLTPLQCSIILTLLDVTGQGFFGTALPPATENVHGQPAFAAQQHLLATWPGMQQYRLTSNHRNEPQIQEMADALFSDEKARPHPRAVDSPFLLRFEAPSDLAEAEWVATNIAELLSPRQPNRNAQKDWSDLGRLHPQDIAILIRTASLGTSIHAALQEKSIPVFQPERDCFWNNPGVALLLRYIGRIHGIAITETAEERHISCPYSVINKGPLALAAFFATTPPFTEEFWQSAAFRAFSKAYEAQGKWLELLRWIALQNNRESAVSVKDAVRILTYDDALGLEFPVVFLPCLEDGLVPFAGQKMLSGKFKKDAIPPRESELFLFQNAILRAKNILFFSCANQRQLQGHNVHLRISPFLAKLPLAPMLKTAGSAQKEATPKEQPLSLLDLPENTE